MGCAAGCHDSHCMRQQVPGRTRPEQGVRWDLQPITHSDLVSAMRQVRASVSQDDLLGYVEWDKTFGSFADQEGGAAASVSKEA